MPRCGSGFIPDMPSSAVPETVFTQRRKAAKPAPAGPLQGRSPSASALSASFALKKSIPAAPKKEGGPPTPRRPAYYFLTYPNSPARRKKTTPGVTVTPAEGSAEVAPEAQRRGQISDGRSGRAPPAPEDVATSVSEGPLRLQNQVPAGGVFFGGGGAQSRSRYSARFFMLVRARPSRWAASRNSGTTPLLSLW